MNIFRKHDITLIIIIRRYEKKELCSSLLKSFFPYSILIGTPFNSHSAYFQPGVCISLSSKVTLTPAFFNNPEKYEIDEKEVLIKRREKTQKEDEDKNIKKTSSTLSLFRILNEAFGLCLSV